jgi:hypothetical protein
MAGHRTFRVLLSSAHKAGFNFSSRINNSQKLQFAHSDVEDSLGKQLHVPDSLNVYCLFVARKPVEMCTELRLFKHAKHINTG